MLPMHEKTKLHADKRPRLPATLPIPFPLIILFEVSGEDDSDEADGIDFGF